MNAESIPLAGQIAAVITTVVATLGGGAFFRRLLSRDSVQRAKDGAESDYFGSAIGEITADRNNWRDSAKEAWERVTALTAENAMLKMKCTTLQSQMKLMSRLARDFPGVDLDKHFSHSSGPGGLDSKPAETAK